MQKRLDEGAGPQYELDTVLPDGSTLTTLHPVTACGSLGVAEPERETSSGGVAASRGDGSGQWTAPTEKTEAGSRSRGCPHKKHKTGVHGGGLPYRVSLRT